MHNLFVLNFSVSRTSYRGEEEGGGGGSGTILTMTITIDNYWLDLIIIKESYCGRVLNSKQSAHSNGDSVCPSIMLNDSYTTNTRNTIRPSVRPSVPYTT